MLQEVHKIKGIFNDSQQAFTQMYKTLHQDFSKRLTDMIERTTLIDEVRNLYELQVASVKEDLKRFDLKTERAVREIDKEKYLLK